MNFINIKNFKHFPLNKQFHLTKEGLDELKARLDKLREERFLMCNRLRRMDAKEKIEHILSSDTIKALEINEVEVDKISEILKHADSVESGANKDGIGLGSVVSLQFGKRIMQFRLVDPIEADPERHKISDRSPLGLALLGKRKNTRVKVVNTKGKEYLYKVLNVA